MKHQILVPNAIVAGLTLFFLANPANAGEGFSIGASAARADVDVRGAGIDVKGESNGLRVFGLYMVNKNFGIEAGYTSLGEPDDNSIPSDMEVETDSYDVYAVGYYPVSEKLGLLGKVGVASWNTETEVGDDDSTERSHKSTDLALSFGGQYDLSERFAVRGEYKWFDTRDSGAANLVSLSGVVRFK
jgi:OOP family OmpA-OmpF porin